MVIKVVIFPTQILVTLSYLSVFKEVGDHDDDLGVLLPHHLPKGRKSALNRTLSGNVGSRLAEAVNEVGIQVVFTVVPTVSVGFIILRTAF